MVSNNDDETEKLTSAVNEARAPEELPETEDSEIERAARETPPGLPVRVVDVTKQYDGLTAIEDLSFELEEGSLTALIGPNGAGKSTVLNLLSGITNPDTGTIYFHGEDISGLGPRKIAQQGIARTTPTPQNYEYRTVLEDILFSVEGLVGANSIQFVAGEHDTEADSQVYESREAVLNALDWFDLGDIANEPISDLSREQRKFVEVVRAVVIDPDVVLLDESFGGLNPSSKEKLLARVYSLCEQGYTFLIAEQDVEFVMANADHVFVLANGELIDEGAPGDIRIDDPVGKP